MLRPSYSDLMNILNQDTEMDAKITSRYSIVIAASKRARQIINGAPHDASGVLTDKAVSIAINEINRGRIKIFPEGIADPIDKNLLPEQIKQPKIKASENIHNFDEDSEDDDDFDDDDFDDDYDLNSNDYDIKNTKASKNILGFTKENDNDGYKKSKNNYSDDYDDDYKKQKSKYSDDYDDDSFDDDVF